MKSTTFREELRALLGHVREGFARLDSDEIDEFELDDLIHRYQRAAGKLRTFCGSAGGGVPGWDHTEPRGES